MKNIDIDPDKETASASSYVETIPPLAPISRNNLLTPYKIMDMQSHPKPDKETDSASFYVEETIPPLAPISHSDKIQGK